MARGFTTPGRASLRGVGGAVALTVTVAFGGRWLFAGLGFIAEACCGRGDSAAALLQSRVPPGSGSRPRRSGAAPRTALRAGSVPEVVREVEARGEAARDNWVVDVTNFLEPEYVEAAEARCAKLGIACLRAGGYEAAERARLVVTNPDLVDASGDEDITAGHAVVLYIEADFANSDPLPNVLDNIGISLDSVGDIRVDGDAAYVALDPDVVKVATRLLRRALADVRTCEVLEPEYEPQGDLQEVELVRVDKRQNRNKRLK